ncbi:MAG: hypothetical protein R3345_04690 [Fulvivirga sp.]|nr:hypothetical protein [Fulvivirga sp.]
MKKYLFLALILTAWGCEKVKQSERQAVYYYNIDSLLTAQRNLLIAKSAHLDKWAFVDQDTTRNTLKPDSTWKDELAFFKKMDINKPVLEGVYEVNTVEDANSNLKVRSYAAPKGREVEVNFLKVYYLNDINKLKRIEALYTENNPIYTSSRYFTLKFDDVKGETLLQQFSVKGGQKMIFKDSISFEVKGTVKLR